MDAIALERDRYGGTGLMVLTAGLMTIGAVIILSASATVTKPLFGEQWYKATWVRQAGFTLVGLMAMLLVAGCSYQRLGWPGRRKWLPILGMLLTLTALGLVLVPGIGVERNGARRWLSVPGLDVYGVGFQPSELAKLTLIVFLAAWLSRPIEQVRSFWKGFVPGVLVVGLCAGLVGVEDFGTAGLLAGVGGAMLLVGGVRIWHLVLAAVPGVAGFAYLLISAPYRLERLASFMDIWADPKGKGYHAIQSLCTIASGDWWGRGLGEGIQKYGYLPEARTDFVFAVVCEEVGVGGGLLILGLFAVLLWQGGKALYAAADSQGRLLVTGVMLLLGLQAAMNVAVVTASVPPKGIALPFVSAGGSGVIFLCTAVGLVASVARRNVRIMPCENEPSCPAESSAVDLGERPNIA